MKPAPESLRISARRLNERAESSLHHILGEWCDFCGERDVAVLQIDHIFPIRRAETGRTARLTRFRLLQALREGREDPFNLHTLCANCHQRKTKIELQRPVTHAQMTRVRRGRGAGAARRRCLLCKIPLREGVEAMARYGASHYCRACWSIRTRGLRAGRRLERARKGERMWHPVVV
jgi:hypothetical protein